MSYPKQCPKCDQFGSWCFCVFPVEPAVGLIWLAYDASTQCYTATYKGHAIRLDSTAKASNVVAELHNPIESTVADEHGRVGIPYTNRAWDSLLNVGTII